MDRSPRRAAAMMAALGLLAASPALALSLDPPLPNIVDLVEQLMRPGSDYEADPQLVLLRAAAIAGIPAERVAYEPPVEAASLDAAILRLYGALELPAGGKTTAILRSDANALYPGIARPTALLVNALVDARILLQAAYARLTPDDRQFLLECSVDRSACDGARLASGKIDQARMLQAGLVLLDAARQALPSLKAASNLVPRDGNIVFRDPHGLIDLGDAGSNRLQGNALPAAWGFPREYQVLNLDFGGDDVYATQTTIGPCSTGGSPDVECFAAQCVWNPCSPLTRLQIDLGGDDTYSTVCGEALGLQGAAFLGLGILLEPGGNDVYSAACSAQGYGSMGVGLLFDYAGDDQYFLSNRGQGEGWAGLGILLDALGHDRYEASQRRAQGIAEDGGIGLLLDLLGSDTYIVSFDRCICQGAAYKNGGAGILADADGADTYSILGGGRGWVGGPAWPETYGLALFFDRGGTDTYNPPHIGANNAVWTQTNPFASLGVGIDR